MQRHARASVFFQRRPIGRDRLLQPCRAALALAEGPERVAEVLLRHGPFERHARASAFFQRRPVGRDRLLQPCRSALALAECPERVTEVLLRRGPFERHARAGAEFNQALVPRDRGLQRVVVAEFVALLIVSLRLPIEVAHSLRFMGTPRRKHRGRVGEVLGGIGIAQTGQSDLAALRQRRGGIDSKAVERAPLLCLDKRQKTIRFRKLACIDRLPRVNFKCCDFWIVARLWRCCCAKILEPLRHFNQLGPKLLRRNVRLTQNRSAARTCR